MNLIFKKQNCRCRCFASSREAGGKPALYRSRKPCQPPCERTGHRVKAGRRLGGASSFVASRKTDLQLFHGGNEYCLPWGPERGAVGVVCVKGRDDARAISRVRKGALRSKTHSAPWLAELTCCVCEGRSPTALTNSLLFGCFLFASFQGAPKLLLCKGKGKG